MEVDWGQAARVGGVGFGMVFLLLIILAIVVWVGGLVINKISASKAETTERKGD